MYRVDTATEATWADKMLLPMVLTALSPLAKLQEEQAHGEDNSSKDTDLHTSAKRLAPRRNRHLSQ